jgi:probable phosphoglycerate mutase
MATGRILFLRHGEVRPPRAGVMVGRLDVALTERGLEQAAAWGLALARLPLAAAVSSPLTRARQTAEIVLAGRGIEAQVWPELIETDLGAWQGLTKDEIEARFPGGLAARGRDFAGYRPEGGENYKDVCARVAPALARLAEMARRAQAPVLVTAHAGVIRAAVAVAVGLDPGRLMVLGQAFCAMTIVGARDERYELTALNLPPGTDIMDLIG